MVVVVVVVASRAGMHPRIVHELKESNLALRIGEKVKKSVWGSVAIRAPIVNDNFDKVLVGRKAVTFPHS